jgi:hypothetical protein
VILAVPAVVVVVPIVALLLFYFVDWRGIAAFVAQVFRGIPVVGSQIHDAIVSLGAAFGAWVGARLAPAIQPLIDAVDFIVGIPTWIVRTATAALTWAYIAIVTTTSQLGVVRAWAEAQVASILGHLASLASRLADVVGRVTAAEAAIARVVAITVPAAIATAVGQAVNRARELVAAASASLSTAILVAKAAVLAALGQEAAARLAADAAVRAAAAAEAAAVGRAASAAIAAEAAATLAGDAALERTIAGLRSQVGEWAGPATIAATITATLTEVSRLRRCADPMCSYLTPQLAALTAIQDAALLAALTGLAVQASHDPEGAARETVAAVGSIEGAISGALGALTGIRI